HELGRLLGGGQLWRRHDLAQRHAGAVEIDVRELPDVHVLARILLEVDALERDALDLAAPGMEGAGFTPAPGENQVEVAVLAQRLVVLRDLIRSEERRVGKGCTRPGVPDDTTQPQ